MKDARASVYPIVHREQFCRRQALVAPREDQQFEVNVTYGEVTSFLSIPCELFAPDLYRGHSPLILTRV